MCNVTQSVENEVFICDALRTPVGKYGGALSSVRPDDLLANVLRTLVERSGIPTDLIEEVVIGCANQAGEDNRNIARMSALLAGLPVTVPGVTINRLCASGLDAIGLAARSIKAGELDLAIAGGVESMSRAPFVMAKANAAFSRQASIEDTTIGWRFVNPTMEVQHGVDSMPSTAENVADDHGVSREDQDAFAIRSQERASAALKSGVFNTEIIPVSVPAPKKTVIEVSFDEHPRLSSLDQLALLRPIVRPDGTVTAGNASGVNDGACAMILASTKAVEEHNLTPRARVLGLASGGVAPRTMGMGPVVAVARLNARLGLSMSDYDVIELNEAFASQALACLREFGIADNASHVNPNGGAIALGHPLGMSGARMVTTLTRELNQRGARYGLATMCVGVGQGVALAIEAIT
ncbi:3-oxoadipyl-CoA thiolase [Sulfitobacter sp. F26204]|uniref:3-oxoadipyl-CoA thiolase n=1 Tax=Sulfitobacter sp. F26204 TaxID=2996014 RepID=UPI00225DF05D|nr:3-oxoadipyl-CoA thiolase [Sulfitobacter sp. F26204]MCX7561345.1 3-oxoadipyl-CoA thiolase [Sulfitobacter sp. F26204]